MLDPIKNQLPEFAKDLKLNLSTVLDNEDFSRDQTLGCALASAYAARHKGLQAAILAEADFDETYLYGIKAAHAIMGMNNIYYRFLHLTKNEAYKKLPANLRMNIIKNHGIDDQDYEMFAFAVSVINACDMCVEAHEQNLRKQGLSETEIQTVVRIASVIHAVAVTLDAEAA